MKKVAYLLSLTTLGISFAYGVEFNPSREQPSCGTIATVFNNSQVYDFLVHGLDESGNSKVTIIPPHAVKSVYLFSNASTNEITPYDDILSSFSNIASANLVSDVLALDKIGVVSGDGKCYGCSRKPSAGKTAGGAVGAVMTAANSLCKLFRQAFNGDGSSCFGTTQPSCKNPTSWTDMTGAKFSTDDETPGARPFIIRVGNLDISKNRILDSGQVQSSNVETKSADISGY